MGDMCSKKAIYVQVDQEDEIAITMGKNKESETISMYILSSSTIKGFKIGVHIGSNRSLRARLVHTFPDAIIHLYYPMIGATITMANEIQKNIDNMSDCIDSSLIEVITLVIQLIDDQMPINISDDSYDGADEVCGIRSEPVQMARIAPTIREETPSVPPGFAPKLTVTQALNVIENSLQYADDGILIIENDNDYSEQHADELLELGDNACYETARRGNAKLLQKFRRDGVYWSNSVLEAAILSNNWATISYAIRHCDHTLAAINLAFMQNCDAFNWFAKNGLTVNQICMLSLSKCRTRGNLLTARRILNWTG